MIFLQCECGKSFHVSEQAAGKKATCSCGAKIKIPQVAAIATQKDLPSVLPSVQQSAATEPQEPSRWKRLLTQKYLVLNIFFFLSNALFMLFHYGNSLSAYAAAQFAIEATEKANKAAELATSALNTADVKPTAPKNDKVVICNEIITTKITVIDKTYQPRIVIGTDANNQKAIIEMLKGHIMLRSELTEGTSKTHVSLSPEIGVMMKSPKGYDFMAWQEGK